MTESDPRPLLDNKGFNDPSAWGFCRYCAFDVAVYMGRMVEHRRYRNGHDDAECAGSGKKPGPPTLEASAIQLVSLHKTIDRARRRAYWQRMRWTARGLARASAAKIWVPEGNTPTRVTVTSAATGEEIDLTGMINGPIRLEEADGEE